MTQPILRLTGSLLLWMTAATAAFGALTWENATIKQEVLASAGKFTGGFRFRNSGTTEVTITSIKPACGCTTVDLVKRTYAPGETGEITVVYEFGTTLASTQHKTIAVTTDDPASDAVELRMEVTIVEEFAYSPRLLLWSVGSAMNEKTSTFRAKTDRKITAVEIAAIEPQAQAVARVTSQSGGYQIVAHPTSTQQAQQVAVSGTVTLEGGAKLPFSVYLLVR